MSISRCLARIALGVSCDSLTPLAREAAIKLILDTLGTAIAGQDQPGVAPALEQLAEWGGRPECRVLVHGHRLPAPNAAFANSAMIHALDYDDGHMPGAAIHVMCTLLPCTLAAAELAGRGGRELVEAVVAGVEVCGRLGLAYGPRRKHPYWLPATILGGFGSTAAACRLMGLDEDRTVNAMGIYYAQAAGNRQALVELTLTKRLQPAFAARSVMWAVALARRNETGPELAFEGPGGLFRLYGSDEPPDEEEVGARRDFFEVERTSVKRFPTCGAQQGAIHTAIALAEEHDLDPAEVEAVELYIGEGGGNPIVSRPFKMGGEHPQVDAQFCAPWGVAQGLVHRRLTLADISENNVRSDRLVGRIAEGITILDHWDAPVFERPPDARLPAWLWSPMMVRVRTRDGRTLECVRTSLQVFDPAKVSLEVAARKFRQCADFSGVCSPERAEEIMRAVRGIEGFRDVSEFIDQNLVLTA
jgi:2-methylcitrate dehydratase PrpD